MKSKEQIQNVIDTEQAHLDDSDFRMDEHEWANSAGWIEALEWVLGNIKVGNDFIPEEELDESSK